MPDPAVLTTGGPQRLELAPMAKQADPTMQTKNGAAYDSLRQIYHPPSYGGGLKTDGSYENPKSYTTIAGLANQQDLPTSMPRGMTHMPVQYGGPSEEKENMDRLNTLYR